MSKHLPLVFLVPLSAGILVLFLLWRADKLPFAWKTFHSAAYHFSFQYPADWDSTCCPIDGPVSPTSGYVLSLSDPGTVRTNTDEPFDGLSIYVDPNPSHESFQEYIAQEQDDLIALRLGLGLRSFPIDARVHLAPQTGKTAAFALNGREGVRLNDFIKDDISRFYVPFPDNQHILILAARLGLHSEWDKKLENILQTFRFKD